MIAADKTMIIEPANVIPKDWAGNSGTVRDGVAVAVGVGAAAGIPVGVGVDVGDGAGVKVTKAVTTTFGD